MTTVGLLHPGAMGAVIGSALTRTYVSDGTVPVPVLWASDGRSAQTVERADAAGLRDAGTLAEVVAEAELILSVCPPEAAVQVADEVAGAGFGGLYVDANAVAPATARDIATRFDRYVDAGIVGPPPTRPGTTRLYLSGHDGDTALVAELFAGGPVEARVVSGGPGAASAVKMCFAGWTKGTAALMLALRALAEAEGVTDALLAEWATSRPELVGRGDAASATAGPKAWRFAGEMDEIAATFAAHDLPAAFHEGAADLYRRLAPLKGATSPSLDDVLKLLLGP